jgi:hypothetical protein
MKTPAGRRPMEIRARCPATIPLFFCLSPYLRGGFLVFGSTCGALCFKGFGWQVPKMLREIGSDCTINE